MKLITDLANFIAPNTDNIFGRIKDKVYSGSTPVEQGSRILADYVMDALGFIYFIAAKRGVTLNGTADNTSASQAYDIVFAEVMDIAKVITDAAARQLSLGNWTTIEYAGLGPIPNNSEAYYTGDAFEGTHMFLFKNTVTGKIQAVRYTDIAYKDIKDVMDYNTTALESNLIYVPEEDVWVTLEPTQIGTASCRIGRSTDGGDTWSNFTLDSNTTSVGKVMSYSVDRIIIPSYDNDNKYYQSTNGGASWSTVSQPLTSPLYKPVASATNGDTMIWVDESAFYVRLYNTSTLWTDATLVGGTLDGSTNKKVVWTGTRFVITDNTTNFFMSREDDITTFDMYPQPDISGSTANVISGGDGVVIMSYGARAMYTATEEQAAAGNWIKREGLDTDNSWEDLEVLTFDGDAHAGAGPLAATGGSFIGRSNPVQG